MFEQSEITSVLNSIAAEKIDSRVYPVLLGVKGRMANQHFVINKKIIAVGRDMNSDILLTGPDVAKRHCCIIYGNFQNPDEPPDCKIFDGGITTGTFVNNERVGVEGYQLRDKDQIRIGKSVFAFFLRGPDEASVDTKLEEMATRDQVTGLLNLRLFKETVTREMARCRRHQRPLSLLLVDIDRANDLYNKLGRDGGNAMLKVFSDFLVDFCRPSDIASRLSGAEIFVMLPETNGQGARVAAERISDATRKHEFKYGATDVVLTISVGVSEWDGQQSVTEFLDQVERALEQARLRGPSHILFL